MSLKSLYRLKPEPSTISLSPACYWSSYNYFSSLITSGWFFWSEVDFLWHLSVDFGSVAGLHVSSMWTMFKHIALEWLIPLLGSQVHGTEFLQQLFLLGLVIVPSYCSHSSLDFPSRIFLSLPHHWLILCLSKSLNTWSWKGLQEVNWSRVAHSRAKSQCKVAHCTLETLQGNLAPTQGVRICSVGPTKGQTESLVRKYCQWWVPNPRPHQPTPPRESQLRCWQWGCTKSITRSCSCFPMEEDGSLMSGLGYTHRNPEDSFLFYRALWEKKFIHQKLNYSVQLNLTLHHRHGHC